MVIIDVLQLRNQFTGRYNIKGFEFKWPFCNPIWGFAERITAQRVDCRRSDRSPNGVETCHCKMREL
jgi:hypothetical protein